MVTNEVIVWSTAGSIMMQERTFPNLRFFDTQKAAEEYVLDIAKAWIDREGNRPILQSLFLGKILSCPIKTVNSGFIGQSPRTNRPEAVTPCPLDLPPRRHQPLEPCPPRPPGQVLAHDDSRVGVLPMIRRRMTACGVHPIATVSHQFDHVDLDGAVEPTTGDSFRLALPWLHTSTFQLWIEHVAQAFPHSFTIRVLDHEACPQAKAVQGPAKVTPGLLPPDSPELTPMERLWRDLQDQWADGMVQTRDAWSAVSGLRLQRYAQTALHS